MAEEDPSLRRNSSGLVAALAGAVGVEPAETGSVALMLAHSFAMGLSTVLFETAASALFLHRFDTQALPFVYFAAAAASGAVGAAYARARGRFGFGAQMLGTLGGLLLGTLALRSGLALTTAVALPFALMVWYRVLSILTDLEYWAVATRLYDVRQAKRLFGVIGSGEVVARIAGAFSVPLLLRVTAVENLLLFSAAALGACVMLLWQLLRRPDFQPDPLNLDRGEDGSREGAGRGVLRDPYLRLLIGLAFFAVLGKYFVDFAYLAEVRARVDGTRGLASFLALFSGVSQSLSLATRLFVSRRVLSRWGVRFGLLVLPTLQLACTSLLLAAGLIPGAGAAIFWLVVANQGVYKTLKHPIDNPSFKILYQPIERRNRLSTQVFVETVANPTAIAFAGLVMLLFAHVGAWSPVLFALPLLLTFGLWTAIARRAGFAYAAAIAASLRGRIRSVAYSFADRRNLPVIREALLRGRPGEALFALELLDRATESGGRSSRRPPAPVEPGEGQPEMPPPIGPDEHTQLLVDLLGHASPDVRTGALQRLGKRWTPLAGRAVESLLERESSPRVRGTALRTLAASGSEADLEKVARFQDDPEPAVRAGVLAALLESGRGAAQLERLASSPDPVERGRAARILADVAGGFDEPLDRLLGDAHPQVCRLALTAVARQGETALWPRVVAALDDPRLAAAAARALATGGPAAQAALLAAREGVAPRLRGRMSKVLGRLRTPEARAALVADLDAPDELVRSAALDALAASGTVLADHERGRAEAQLQREIEDASWTAAARARLAADPTLGPLREALGGEIERNRDRILELLGLLYGSEAVRRARRNLDHESRERRARAMELLDLVIPAAIKVQVLPLLAEDAGPAPGGRAAEPGTGVPAELLARGPGRIGPWATACAVEAVARLHAVELAPKLAALRSASEHAIVRELAEFSLARLERTDGAEATPGEGRRMNTIERVLTLKTVEMFSLASEEALADIAAVLEEVLVGPGDVIIEQGDVGDSMYIIIEGRVRVFDRERTFARLGERDIFGELALLDPEPRSASIAAERETRLFRLDREAFLELLAGNIEIVRGVLQVLCKRVRRSVQTHGAY